MKELIEILRERSEAELSLTDLQKMRVFPWARNYRTLRAIVEADILGPNILKAKVSGARVRRRYVFKKQNIISYLETYGTVLMAFSRPKQKNGRSKKVGGKSRA